MYTSSTCRLMKNISRRRITMRTCGAFGMIAIALQSASADPLSEKVDKVLNETVTNTQQMAQLVNQGCSGGGHGTNPIHQDMVLSMSADVANKINDIRLALAKGGDLSPQVQVIDTIDAELQKMTDVTHQNCLGGSHGTDPAHFGEMVRLKEKTVDTLDTLKKLFT